MHRSDAEAGELPLFEKMSIKIVELCELDTPAAAGEEGNQIFETKSTK